MRNLRADRRGAMPILIAVGLLFVLAGLALVVLGAILATISFGAVFTVGTGWWLMIVGGVLAFFGVLL
jgi:hypothetical protein